MKFDLDQKVIEYLRGRNQSQLTIELEEIQPNCCVGRLPEIKFLSVPPANPSKYRHFLVNGIDIHVSKQLRTENTIKLTLSGIGPFKNLEITGVNLIF